MLNFFKNPPKIRINLGIVSATYRAQVYNTRRKKYETLASFTTYKEAEQFITLVEND